MQASTTNEAGSPGWLRREALHEALRETVWNAFSNGDYAGAGQIAFTIVEGRMRHAAGLPKDVRGKELVGRAFEPKNGILTDETANPSDRSALFAFVGGAFAFYRNPLAHGTLTIGNALEAGEIIMLASHLLRIVDQQASGRTLVSEEP